MANLSFTSAGQSTILPLVKIHFESNMDMAENPNDFED
jgi:hypothetical protein